MLEIPKKSFSQGVMIIGIIFTIISFFWLLFSLGSAFRYGGDSSQFGSSFISFLFSLSFIIIGNKKVVDPDYLIIFLKDFIKK